MPTFDHACHRIRWGLAALVAAGVFWGGGLRARGQQGLPPMNANLVFLDPAHGGPDPGAHLSDTLAEKDVTLGLAGRLRAALAAKGFSVVSTRDGDNGLTSDQRAEMGNHARPLACLLLHATVSGSGTYVAASALAADAGYRTVLPWETAQAAYIAQSVSLLDGVAGVLKAANLKPVVLRASVPPIDSLTCPALLLELAPLSGNAVTDGGYQQRVVDGLVEALTAWRTANAPAPKTLSRPAGAGDAPGGTTAPRDARPGSQGKSLPSKPPQSTSLSGTSLPRAPLPRASLPRASLPATPGGQQPNGANGGLR